MRRLVHYFVVFSALSLCVCFSPSESRAQAFSCCTVPGDADNNDVVNVADITFLIARIFSGGPAPRCMREGDANGSGKVNISDITFLISRIFASGPAPECATTPLPAPFPNEIGNWWEYERFDSLTLTLDTVHLEVVDTATLPNGELAGVWERRFPTGIDTQYVSLVETEAGDSVKVYERAFLSMPQMLYLYPLDTVKEWYNVAPQEPPSCHFRFVGGFPETIQTPLATFSPAFKIWSSGMPLPCAYFCQLFGQRRDWLVNGIGIVQATRYERDCDVLENNIWSLVAFDTTPPCNTCN